MKQPEQVEIELKDTEGNTVLFVLNWDSHISDYVVAFKSMLTFLTFQPETIQSVFNEDVD